jgi:hypothetical protein
LPDSLPVMPVAGPGAQSPLVGESSDARFTSVSDPRHNLVCCTPNISPAVPSMWMLAFIPPLTPLMLAPGCAPLDPVAHGSAAAAGGAGSHVCGAVGCGFRISRVFVSFGVALVSAPTHVTDAIPTKADASRRSALTQRHTTRMLRTGAMKEVSSLEGGRRGPFIGTSTGSSRSRIRSGTAV